MHKMSPLEHALPEEVGIDSKGLERFIELVQEKQVALHSFMLLRHGKVAAEAYYAPFRKDKLHHIFSISKSVTSARWALPSAREDSVFRTKQ
jgi:CubicO group peptidase (beta-lactamase class C family)